MIKPPFTAKFCRAAKAACIAAACVLAAAGCGQDVMPVFFPPSDDGTPTRPTPAESASTGECTVSYESRLCVIIKGDAIEAGAEADTPLCVEVAPFPIHLSGTQVSIRGSEFPDVLVEGNGLPAPITINARGTGSGTGNVGEGSIDPDGTISIHGFSFFIVALGMVGEIPNLTLTTDSTDELPHLPVITGSPPDASGAMSLVTGTILGPMFDAADKFLMGASMQGTFSGSISPTLAECASSGGPRSIEITKLIVDTSGAQTDAGLPDDSIMEISGGTYIASSPADVGPRFEASAKFRIKNVGSRTVNVRLSPRIGAFALTSLDALTQALPPQRSFIITVSFRPTSAETQPGTVTEQLVIGTDMFTLTAVALTSDGSVTVDVIDDGGATTKPNVGDIDVGSSSVPVNARREYFLCDEIDCGGSPGWTKCRPCQDPASKECVLLALSTDGAPLAEVDDVCMPIRPDAAPLLAIDLKGTTDASVGARKQVIAIRNTGVAPLTVTGIRLEPPPSSQSVGEFYLDLQAVFVARSFDEIRSKVDATLAGQQTQGASFPITLNPYYPGVAHMTIYVVITYRPKDLVGSDGTPAGVGSNATDRAVLRIITTDDEAAIGVTGSTSIREVPPLELYFKTPTGLKRIEENKAFSFRSITADTVDSAAPLFLKLADSATSPMRIVAIEVGGGDSSTFEWLDTADKIGSKNPPSGKGMRCSIPIVDESTGQMTGEIFDLKPVSIGSGFDLMPGAYSTETMPLFGCINYHRDGGPDGTGAKRLFEATITVKAYKLDATNNPVRNPDGSFQQSIFPIRLLAAINPRTGKLVFRVTQTMSIILNPQFPGMSAIGSRDEMSSALASGVMKHHDLAVMLGAFILDPFDEETVTDTDGVDILSTPGDGITGVFRPIDSHIVSRPYDDPYLNDYTNLLYDGLRPPGERGVFEDFPNLPEDTRSNPWRIFTAMLSYPGPLAPLNERPEVPSLCTTINPCDPAGLKKFTDAGVGPGEKGACTFFYATGGRYDSPAFHAPAQMQGGEFKNLCTTIDSPQKLYPINTGYYSLDGSLNFEEIGLRFFGPTFFHNPGGPLGPVPPMDIVFHTAFTTDALLPQTTPEDYNVVPDQRIDIQHQQYKINLDDPTHINPGICAKSIGNRIIDGRTLSSWTYMKQLLSRDEHGEIPAGCPQPGINDHRGGTAFLHGRPLNHETGEVTFVAATKFGSANELTFAFKDVMMFVVINGWICDPLGNEEMLEGSRCYDVEFNDRDAATQFSMTEG